MSATARAIQVGLPSLILDIETSPREGIPRLKEWKDIIQPQEHPSHEAHGHIGAWVVRSCGVCLRRMTPAR